jgi:hypothetical protein
MNRELQLLASATTLALCLTACGGGGSHAEVIPPPPPPPPQAAVAIFANPAVGEFASVGASANASDVSNLNAPLGTISTADSDQLHIRFTDAGQYEIELPGQEWDELIPYGQGTEGTVITDSDNDVLLVLSGSKDKGYKYSELASYRTGGPDMIGAIAFGTLTPSGGVPTTGSATYSGAVMGKSDVIASDSFDGPNRATVTGSVRLDFDFAAGTLGGAMTVGLDDAAGDALSLGTFAFTDTVFSTGSPSYSGKFDSNTAGQNFFLGQFSGPNAEETIGAWALPFVLDTGNDTIQADHQAHQLFGAWIAKKP